MISGGFAGIYGAGRALHEVLEEEGLLEQIELEIVAGVQLPMQELPIGL